MLASPKKKNARLVFPVGHFIIGIAFGKTSKKINLKPGFLGFLSETNPLLFQEDDKENQSQNSDSCTDTISNRAGQDGTKSTVSSFGDKEETSRHHGHE
jgi:hypothetical protein